MMVLPPPLSPRVRVIASARRRGISVNLGMRIMRALFWILLALTVALPLAVLAALVVAGALTQLYGLLATLLDLKPLSTGIFCVCAGMLFVGFLYLFCALLPSVLLAGRLPVSAAATN